MIAGAAVIGILLLLAAVHVYWAAGGKAGKAAGCPDGGRTRSYQAVRAGHGDGRRRLMLDRRDSGLADRLA